jgi:two-component system KDP operon response regulator KdpE
MEVKMIAEPVVIAVDDEKSILQLVRAALDGQGFHVLTAQSGDEAVRLSEQYRPDVALIDIRMPDVNGLETMRRLRAVKQMPVILLTAMGESRDKVRGLEQGADDYLTKPFDPDELAARVRAVLRRGKPEENNRSLVRADNGRVEIDLESQIVKKEGQPVNLSRSEWQLLKFLAANAGKVMLSNQVLNSVWGPEYRDEFQYLRVWVFRLRQKLEETPSEPRVIKTLPGIGLLLDGEIVAATP